MITTRLDETPLEWPGAMMEVENLGIKFGNLQVLQNLDFTVRKGEFVSLLGPSGCGKSTLLRALAGLLIPSEGHVLLLGDGEGADRLPVRLGMMFQKPLLLAWRTTLQNVVLPAEIEERGRKASFSALERAKKMLSLVQLDDFADVYPHHLSGGMQQRAALARTLMSDPDVLLLDEPFGALDEITRETLNDELLNIWKSHETRLKTIVMVTHSIPEAVALSDRIFVFGTRPARLQQTVEVPLGHPREPGSSEFARVLGQVRHLVRGEA